MSDIIYDRKDDNAQILYDKDTMEALFDGLKTEGSKIQGEIEALGTAKDHFLAAMASQGAQDGFIAAHSKVNTELEDTLHKLDQLAIAVENALHRALETDKKIGDGFAAFA
ncbi:type VII secretion protein EsxR [Nocardia sp. NPDC051750]|uniref:type VII secretion protein EsxR n=1 Tax=Nocardia sp. NPDC051750 TaxID=3364325 RepID=UPI00378C4521